MESDGIMKKLNVGRPASIAIKKNGNKYITWWSNENPSVRYRHTFDVNRLDPQRRDQKLQQILEVINHCFDKGWAATPEQVELKFAEYQIVRPVLKVENVSKKLNEYKYSFNEYVLHYLAVRVGVVSDNTLKAVKVHKNRVNEFAQAKLNKAEMEFDDFKHPDFPLLYLQWSYETLQWGQNYAAKSLQILKKIIDAAWEDKILHEEMHYSKRWRVGQIETDDIALDLEQLQLLLDADIGNEAVVRTRDMFVFASLTGLRFGDFSRLDKLDFVEIKGKNGGKIKCVKIFTEKTDEKVIVPLHKIAKEIFDKYSGLPKVDCNQVFNRNIKKACEAADLTEIISLRKNKGGKNITERMPFFKAVSAHSARRSFATIAYMEFKMPSLLIMKITGHKTEKQFLKYVKITKESAALEMAEFLK
jgi:integrase